MKEVKFTKKIKVIKYGDEISIAINNRHYKIAEFFCHQDEQGYQPVTKEEAEANAMLFAIAPKMFNVINNLAIFDEKEYPEIKNLIFEAKNIIKNFNE